jgi:CMP-N-acetylneuraminic acid synthetase|tara:strand:+ start:1052 stop:1717 length:666 start_codon:yes stop_codon:yes gene_type:complete
MNKIGIFSYGRKGSQRCPNKMLRPFSGTTILDILLNKLRILGENTFFAGYDSEFKQKANNTGVTFIQRTKHSVSIDGPQIKCLSFLEAVDYDYLLLINGCLPFMKIKTVKKFMNDVINNGLQPSVVVSKRHNYFFSEKQRPLNFSSKIRVLNTKTITPLYELGNALYFFNRQHFLNTGMFWEWENLRLVEMGSKIELIDIDTEEDFSFAETIWNSQVDHGP